MTDQSTPKPGSVAEQTAAPHPPAAPHHDPSHAPNVHATWAAEHRTARRLALIGMVASAITVLLAIILIPLGVLSLWRDLPAGRVVDIYNLRTGQPVDPNAVIEEMEEASYLDLAVSGIDEAGLVAQFVVSGHRVCDNPCQPLSLIFYAVPERGKGAGGLPPSAQVELPTTPGPFTFPIEMPVYGRPQTYPWDKYSIQLGISVVTDAASPNAAFDLEAMQQIAGKVPLVTLQNWMSEFEMTDFHLSDRTQINEERYPHPLIWVHEMSFTRPAYLQIVTALLLGLITTASLFVLFLRNTRDTMIGIGGLVLGLWSVRSVIVKGDMPDITVVDLVIGMVMVLFLTLTWARVTWHFWRRAKYGPSVKL